MTPTHNPNSSNFDNYQTPYHESHFPDPQSKAPPLYTFCSGCNEEIYAGEIILDVYGMCIHDDFYCLLLVTEARRVRAGEDI